MSDHLNPILLLLAPSAMAAAPDTSDCDAYSGAAKGVCTAYLAQGCDTEEDGGSNSCEVLGERFTALTGELPPGSAVCPCDYSAVFESTYNSCMYSINPGTVPFWLSVMAGSYPDLTVAYAEFEDGVGICGAGDGNWFDRPNPVDISQAEYAACYQVLRDEVSGINNCYGEL